MIDNPVYKINGGVELNGKIHILARLGGVPYRRFCNRQDAVMPLRHLHIHAPMTAFCPTCLKKYERWRKGRGYLPLCSVGQWEVNGLYLVASGWRWTSMDIKLNCPSNSFSARLDYLLSFERELALQLGTYGYSPFQWDSESGVLRISQPIWDFEWDNLLALTIEKTTVAFNLANAPTNKWNRRTSS